MAKTCPCGTEKEFSKCCEPLLKGKAEADGPEALMRSRFVAFTLKDMDYVETTTDPQVRHQFDKDATREWAETNEFFKLEILDAAAEGTKGRVEFKAHFRTKDGKENIHHELSKFRKQAGRWYFRDGKHVPAPEEAATPS